MHTNLTLKTIRIISRCRSIPAITNHCRSSSVFTRIRITPCLQLHSIKLPDSSPPDIAMAFPIPVSPAGFWLLDTLWSPGDRCNKCMSIIAIRQMTNDGSLGKSGAQMFSEMDVLPNSVKKEVERRLEKLV
jgi:hypothetical protein